MTPGAFDFTGKHVLLAEDDYLLAVGLAENLKLAGAVVHGPVARVDAAMALLDSEVSLEVAILDVDLDGEQVFPVADAAIARGLRVVFASGYDRDRLPARFAHVTHCLKPFDVVDIARALGRAGHAPDAPG